MQTILRNQQIFFTKDEVHWIKLCLDGIKDVKSSILAFVTTKTWACIEEKISRCKQCGFDIDIEVDIDGEKPSVKIKISRMRYLGVQGKLFETR